ncbi:MAG: hypothetical protein CMD92_09460 [Gammaproteobacteria bacterium]|nr:hypothetical protein [Gammaproteobacteria bacterium]
MGGLVAVLVNPIAVFICHLPKAREHGKVLKFEHEIDVRGTVVVPVATRAASVHAEFFGIVSAKGRPVTVLAVGATKVKWVVPNGGKNLTTAWIARFFAHVLWKLAGIIRVLGTIVRSVRVVISARHAICGRPIPIDRYGIKPQDEWSE